MSTPKSGPCRGPRVVSRREMIQVGGSLALGLNLSELLRADDRAVVRDRPRGRAGAAGAGQGPRPTADSCILIFLDGGPSHLDMWDMKPDAPGGDPRRVQADRHVASRACRSASTCRASRGRSTAAR